ncbi:FAD-binding oxidoreductase [Alteromonadaceae bacterium BrNp21-10]|nr:FAD-binding oxidoreductase [Alteromonadaceae bacterium BrNp21-10]
MDTIRFNKLDGTSTDIQRSLINDSISGQIIDRNSAYYADACALWNGMIDKSPSLIISVKNDQDVVNAVNFARTHGVLLAIKGGGHNIAGKALVDGGLVIDFQAMTDVLVNESQKTVKVSPGALLSDVDKATQQYGLVVPTGINSTTGIAGLTLGGGFGWTTRKFGLTIDSLCSAKIVTAAGEVVVANTSENSDLFWAIRGGGGNFGVITEFEFNLHRAGPEVLAGMVVHPFSDIKNVLKCYQAVLDNAPDELTCWVVMRKAPPLPFLPAEWHGKEIIVLAMCYVGDIAAGQIATQEMRNIGNPIVDVVGPMPLTDWQGAFDPLLTAGARNYWKSHDMAEINDEAVATIAQSILSLPTAECEIFLAHIGGAATRIAPQDTPWLNRQAHFVVNIHTRWQQAEDDQRCRDWARDLHTSLAEQAMGTIYVNFIPDGDDNCVADAYGANYDRLKRIKQQCDPNNLFRVNQNIVP